jgi:hypothetical protein
LEYVLAKTLVEGLFDFYQEQVGDAEWSAETTRDLQFTAVHESGPHIAFRRFSLVSIPETGVLVESVIRMPEEVLMHPRFQDLFIDHKEHLKNIGPDLSLDGKMLSVSYLMYGPDAASVDWGHKLSEACSDQLSRVFWLILEFTQF